MNQYTYTSDIFLMPLFDGMYFKIDPVWDFEYILEMLAEENKGGPVFGYGFNTEIFDWYTEEDRTERLDMEISHYPVILMSEDQKTLWMNSEAKKIENISECFSFDRKLLRDRFQNKADELLKKGYHSALIQNAPDIFRKAFVSARITKDNLILENFTEEGSPTFFEMETGDGIFLPNPDEKELKRKISKEIGKGRDILIRSYTEDASITAYKALSQLSIANKDKSFILFTNHAITDSEALINIRPLPKNK